MAGWLVAGKLGCSWLAAAAHSTVATWPIPQSQTGRRRTLTPPPGQVGVAQTKRRGSVTHGTAMADDVGVPLNSLDPKGDPQRGRLKSSGEHESSL